MCFWKSKKNEDLTKRFEQITNKNVEMHTLLMNQIDALEKIVSQNNVEMLEQLIDKIDSLEKIVRQNIDPKSSAIDEEKCAKTIWTALEAITNDVKILEDGGQDATYSKDDVLSILARDRKKFEGLLTDYIPDQEDMSNPYKVEEIDSDKDVAPGTEVIPGKRFGNYIIYRAKKIKERA